MHENKKILIYKRLLFTNGDIVIINSNGQYKIQP